MTSPAARNRALMPHCWEFLGAMRDEFGVTLKSGIEYVHDLDDDLHGAPPTFTGTFVSCVDIRLAEPAPKQPAV